MTLIKQLNSIFISKDSSETLSLKSFCDQKGITLTSHSLIDFSPLSFKVKEPYEVVFFSSIRSAEYFLLNNNLSDNAQVACIGSLTASKLKEIGLKVDFTGTKSGVPSEVANEFKIWLGNRRVLFPLSSISNRSILKALPNDQFEEIIVYKTISSCKSIEDHSIYVFTSPSNFHSFIECNVLPADCQIIAWGETTRASIMQKGYNPDSYLDHTLQNSSIDELVSYLKSLPI